MVAQKVTLSLQLALLAVDSLKFAATSGYPHDAAGADQAGDQLRVRLQDGGESVGRGLCDIGDFRLQMHCVVQVGELVAQVLVMRVL